MTQIIQREPAFSRRKQVETRTGRLAARSTQGIKTPKHEIDLIKDRLKRLKEMLR